MIGDVPTDPQKPTVCGGLPPPQTLNERRQGMATKTKAIKVTVDERLAEEIADKGVHCWHATNYSNGRRRVYVTFEEVKTVTAP